MNVRTVEPMETLGIGDERQVGAADEKPALDHADDAADAFLQACRIGECAPSSSRGCGSRGQ